MAGPERLQRDAHGEAGDDDGHERDPAVGQERLGLVEVSVPWSVFLGWLWVP